MLKGGYWEKIRKTKEEPIPAIYITVREPQTDSLLTYWIKFGKCIMDTTIDIAVCRPDTNPFAVGEIKKQISFATFKKLPDIKDGTPVALTGFPLDFMRPITAKGSIASFDATAGEIIADISAWPGASGGPVYLFDGKIIGVLIQGGRNEGIGLARVRHFESITKFLTKNKIRFYQEK